MKKSFFNPNDDDFINPNFIEVGVPTEYSFFNPNDDDFINPNFIE
ncbi:23710_t:CDS:2 [Entrophospora sp. SA101]|nr:23710_t:CDS:2 [Entrophospora sp. SA101]CAJ0840031.1 10387_t:CDS:2 [Entrophospora sp. SA101]